MTQIKNNPNVYVADDNEYRYFEFIVTKDGDFYTPHGRKENWSKDGVHLKLNIGGEWKCVNGLAILYRVYNNVPTIPSWHVAKLKDSTKGRTKENIVVERREVSVLLKRALTNDEVDAIKREYEGRSRMDYTVRSKSGDILIETVKPVSLRMLAEKYNVSLHTIQNALNGVYD